jgi:transposase
MSEQPKYQDREWLRTQYVDKGKTCEEIAEVCDCSYSAVYSWMKKHSIERNPHDKTIANQRLKEADWLREQYVEKKRTGRDIADELGCSPTTVLRWLKKHEVETREGGASLEAFAPDDRLTDPEWVRQHYVEEGMSCAGIAELCDCSESSVQRWVKHHGIETTPYKKLAADERLTDRDWLHEQYAEKGRSGHEIADECGCSWSAVYSWLKKNEIDTRKRGNGAFSGEDHPRWNGGESKYGEGWNESKRNAVRDRDDCTCQDPRCSVTQIEHLDEHGEKLHVHHLRKARDVDDPAERNGKENLITLCRDCHRRWEQIADAGLVPQVVADD